MKWTDDKVNELERLTEKGFTAKQIASIMEISVKSAEEARHRYGILGNGDWVKWGDDKVNRLQELVYKGFSNEAISKILSKEFDESIEGKSVENARQRHGVLKHCLEKDSEIKLYDEAIHLRPDNYMVCCDHHSPYHSERWINRSLQIADVMGIEKCIIPGDLIDNDFIKFYPNPRVEDNSTFDREAKGTRPVFEALDYFKEVILIKGNHEDRVNRATDGKIQARHLFEIIGREIWERKFRYSVYDKLFVGDKWIIVHPRSYSQISASVAVRLAEKFHRHVLNAHGHFFAMRYDRSGQYMGVDLGGMYDMRKVGYVNLKTTTHPLWNNGFAVITADNKVHLFHENTDWKYYGVD